MAKKHSPKRLAPPKQRKTTVSSLTPKQKILISTLLIDPNLKKAAKKAKISYDYARQLVTKSHIKKALKEARGKREVRTGITQDRVLQELASLAFLDIRDLVTWDAEGKAHFVSSEDISPEVAAALQSIKFRKSEVGGGDNPPIINTDVEVRLHSKIKALELTGKHLGMFTEKHEHHHSGEVGLKLSPELQGLVDETLSGSK